MSHYNPGSAALAEAPASGRQRLAWLLLPWSMAVLGWFFVLAQYEAAPGGAGISHEVWPGNSAIRRDANRPTLLMFLHPRCPCSSASIEMLNRILARCAGRAETHVIFMRPQNEPPDWMRTGLWSTARLLPGVEVHDDIGGCEALCFGAATSGTTLLYARSGRLLFQGGITAARGHAGENAGEKAVLDGLLSERSEPRRTPIFGCGLFDTPPTAKLESQTCCQ